METESETMLWSQTYDGLRGDLSGILDSAGIKIVRSMMTRR